MWSPFRFIIAKKPIDKGEANFVDCPTCKYKLVRFYGRIGYDGKETDKYCAHCGQKIDWRVSIKK